LNAALVGLLFFGLVSDLPQFQGKAWLGRALTFPAVALIVPIHDSSELATAYTDTLGDLALGLGGSVLAATLIYGPFRRVLGVCPEVPLLDDEPVLVEAEK
jgi:hypothetical protein